MGVCGDLDFDEPENRGFVSVFNSSGRVGQRDEGFNSVDSAELEFRQGQAGKRSVMKCRCGPRTGQPDAP